MLSKGKAQTSSSVNEDIDLDELMDVSWPMCLCFSLSAHKQSVHLSVCLSVINRILSWKSCMLIGLLLSRFVFGLPASQGYE